MPAISSIAVNDLSLYIMAMIVGWTILGIITRAPLFWGG